MLEHLDWRQRQRVVRAIYRGRAVEDARDAQAAVEACDELREQWVANRLLRWWFVLGWVVLFANAVIALLTDWTVVAWLAGVGVPALTLTLATWWAYRGLPRRLYRAERANRLLLENR